MKRRRGYTLIELAAVIGAGAAILAIASGAIYTLFEAEEASREHLRHALASGRLADQFRRDVHAATGFETLEAPQASRPPADPPADPPPPVGSRFTLSDEISVEYSLDGGAMVRVQRSRGKTTRRETFDLGSHWRASIDRGSEAETAVISLRIQTDRGPSAEPFSRALVIDAVLSMDHRHAKSPEP